MATKKKSETEEEEASPTDLILPTPGAHPRTGEPIKAFEDVDLSEFNDGKGYKHKVTHHEFGLKLDEDDVRGNTHKLKNRFQYWEGTKEQFEADFEKK